MSQLRLGIVVDGAKFRAQMTAIQKDLKAFQRTADVVGKGVNKALSAAGLAVGFSALTSMLKNSTKAASEDIKSQALLANSLRNTVGATDASIASAEAYIKKTQLSTAVLDDELRPALAQAVLATGNLSAGQGLLNTALNVSAGTGKDLGSVTAALSKAYNGNTASLKKLVPGIKTTGDFMLELDTKFAGAAETAAKNDPYKRISVIFADLQETIGMTLLPALEQFSTYLSSPEGQSNLQIIVGIFSTIGKVVANVTNFLIQNIAIIKAVVAALVFVKLAWGAITLAVKAYEIATKIAAVSTKALKTALISTGIGALVVAVGTLAATWLEAQQNVDGYNDSVDAAMTSDKMTFYNGNYLLPGQVAANGWENFTPLVDALNDPRLTDAMKTALKDHLHEVIDIDFLKGRIYADGKLIWSAFSAGAADAIAENSKIIKQALDKQMGEIKGTAEKFRDTVGLAFGTFGKDENSVFNIDLIIAKMKRIATAAKGFASNIAKLRSKNVPQSVIDQLVAMGPAQGNIVAKGLLESGSKLSTFVGLSETLYNTGVSVAGQQAITPNATYEININKAVISAADIIREIRNYEKTTKRKYLVG
jgi:hypothetical protein